MEKELKVNIPEGYEIDRENSTFECIKFKPIKKVSIYDDIAIRLFSNESYWATSDGNIHHSKANTHPTWNNCTSEKQVEKLMAINKLMNVAKYLNGDWKPNWDNLNEYKYTFSINANMLVSTTDELIQYSTVYFKSERALKEAKIILGEDTIKLALSTDW